MTATNLKASTRMSLSNDKIEINRKIHLFVFAMLACSMSFYYTYKSSSTLLLHQQQSKKTAIVSHNPLALYDDTSQIQITSPAVRYQIGTWAGNMWIPPTDWKLFSIYDLQELWSGKSIAWIGDSTSRRAAFTMYYMLNVTTSSTTNNDKNNSIVLQEIVNKMPSQLQDKIIHVSSAVLDSDQTIDINKVVIKEPCSKYNYSEYPRITCRIMPKKKHGKQITNNNGIALSFAALPSHGEYPTTIQGNTKMMQQPLSVTNLAEQHQNQHEREKQFVSLQLSCLHEVEQYFRKEYAGETNILHNIDIVVVANGLWEITRTADCSPNNKNRTDYEMFRDTIYASAKFQNPNRTVVWRTIGFKLGEPKSLTVVRNNEMIMDIIDEYNLDYEIEYGMKSNLTYVNWGSAVQPRSFGNERIRGDVDPHYGAEPRVVMTQMLTNHLLDRGVLFHPNQ